MSRRVSISASVKYRYIHIHCVRRFTPHKFAGAASITLTAFPAVGALTPISGVVNGLGGNAGM